MSDGTISRRELFRWSGNIGGAFAIPMLLPHEPADASATPPAAPSASILRAGPDVYESIGVRPLINARGTYTIISGSVMLPEVRAAMDAAAQRYVHLEGLGPRRPRRTYERGATPCWPIA